MNAVLDVDAAVELWLGNDIPPEILSTPLPDDIAREVVERLKKEFERYWYIDSIRSLDYAERIIAIGRARNDTGQIALGTMSKGDCLASLGNMEEAWSLYEQAGVMFLETGDEVGWARTRVGRLYLGPKLNCIPTTLADAEQARAIFTRHGERDRLLRLDWQTALVYNYLGEQHRALELFVAALAMAESLGEAGQPHISPLYENIGLTYNALGDFHQALMYYERARELAIARNQTLSIARIEASIAEIAQAQGYYLRALTLLHGALEKVTVESPFEVAMTKHHVVECYLSLNRYAEARDLARQVIRDFRMFNAAYELALTLLRLATAEAALGNFTAAQAALAEAEPIFTSLGATTWIATIRLWRGRMALKQGDATSACQEALAAAVCFQADGQQVKDATATLLQGQALFALSDFRAADTAGTKALHIAQKYNVPSLRYAAHLLLGQIAEARHESIHAIRRYRAAAATIERVQRGLTITLRPGFLEDKGEALQALIALRLRAGDAGNAFETLEQAKSQVWLGYLMNRDHLHWAQDDVRNRALIEELDRLRAEHQWFYRLAHDSPGGTEHSSAIRTEQALAEVAGRERRMRAITEQLYLHSGGQRANNHAPAMSLKEIQQTIDEETLLIEYYNDGAHLWAFILDRQTVEAHRLPLTTEALNQLIRQLQANLAAALKVDPQAPMAGNLTHLARRILQRLYALLIEPLALRQYNQRRLVIVPYGALHFLPFHLLYDGSAHLIERYEVITLPAAGLATRPGPRRPPGALILAHSWDGRLPHTQTEAQIVQRLFGGRLCAEEAANRSALQTTPTQILHIAAHGEHRLDQPDLSYLQLADGQLYADDVLQQDLSYELVTLSACETGRANVATDEELIGLGRGFLYAGAGALIISLWGVADHSTTDLMKRMYGALSRGETKSASLRYTQTSILSENRNLHPAYWGAFQLIGDDSALSGPV
ncbi:MAG: CHAT domain-containing protein [Chloroflexi bacterium]|nr:CHAT domain-containing protein [Chloroflexota bacterium]